MYFLGDEFKRDCLYACSSAGLFLFLVTCHMVLHFFFFFEEEKEEQSAMFHSIIDLGPRSHRTRSTLQQAHIVVNESIHTACKQHQRVCTQICVEMCLRVLCERALTHLGDKAFTSGCVRNRNREVTACYDSV